MTLIKAMYIGNNEHATRGRVLDREFSAALAFTVFPL